MQYQEQHRQLNVCPRYCVQLATQVLWAPVKKKNIRLLGDFDGSSARFYYSPKIVSNRDGSWFVNVVKSFKSVGRLEE